MTPALASITVKTRGKLLFTAVAVAFAVSGVLTIANETHTGSTVRGGTVTLLGSDAVWFGQICLVLASLPLVVWLPARWVGWAVTAWWLTLMAWVFLPLVWR